MTGASIDRVEKQMTRGFAEARWKEGQRRRQEHGQAAAFGEEVRRSPW
jgi:hypothetical protein